MASAARALVYKLFADAPDQPDTHRTEFMWKRKNIAASGGRTRACARR
jgi:hypothetical protein